MSPDRPALRSVAAWLLLAVAVVADAADGGRVYALPGWGAPDAAELPAGWQLTTLRNRAPARFQVVTAAGLPVLQADAEEGVGALAAPVALSVSEWPVLAWRWRINNHLPGSDMRVRSGDDFPARVYVTFARPASELSLGTRLKLKLARLVYGQDVPTAALCYVWDRELPVGTAMPNAYTDTIMMIVAESGGAMPAGWVSEAHDVQADYQRLFGEPAPAVTSVIVALDTDDTGGTARAWFADLRFLDGATADLQTN